MSNIQNDNTQCHFQNLHFFCKFRFADTTVKNYLLWHNLTGKIMAFIFQLIKHETKHEYFNLDVAQWVEIHSAAIFLYFEHWHSAFLRDVFHMFRSKYHLSCSRHDIRHSKFWITISKEPFGVSPVCLLGIFFILTQSNLWTNQNK